MPFCRNARSVASAASWLRRRKGDIVMFSISHISTTWKKTKGLVTHHQGTKWEKFHGKNNAKIKNIQENYLLPISLYENKISTVSCKPIRNLMGTPRWRRQDIALRRFFFDQPCGLQLLSFEMILLILLSCFDISNMCSCLVVSWFWHPATIFIVSLRIFKGFQTVWYYICWRTSWYFWWSHEMQFLMFEASQLLDLGWITLSTGQWVATMSHSGETHIFWKDEWDVFFCWSKPWGNFSVSRNGS